MKPVIIRVRDTGNTYSASLAGQRATCTTGRLQAAQAVAEKVYGNQPFQLFGAGIDNSDPARAVHCYRVEPAGDAA